MLFTTDVDDAYADDEDEPNSDESDAFSALLGALCWRANEACEPAPTPAKLRRNGKCEGAEDDAVGTGSCCC